MEKEERCIVSRVAPGTTLHLKRGPCWRLRPISLEPPWYPQKTPCMGSSQTTRSANPVPVAIVSPCEITRQGLLRCIPEAGGQVVGAVAHTAALDEHQLRHTAAILITDVASLALSAPLAASEQLPLLVTVTTLAEGLASLDHRMQPSVLAMPSSITQLHTALVTIAGGTRFVSTALRLPFAGSPLSTREQAVLHLELQGLMSAIATQLQLSLSTVRLHHRNIVTRLRAATIVEMQRQAEELWRRTWWDHALFLQR